jgi:hypothetical protein
MKVLLTVDQDDESDSDPYQLPKTWRNKIKEGNAKS